MNLCFQKEKTLKNTESSDPSLSGDVPVARVVRSRLYIYSRLEKIAILLHLCI